MYSTYTPITLLGGFSHYKKFNTVKFAIFVVPLMTYFKGKISLIFSRSPYCLLLIIKNLKFSGLAILTLFLFTSNCRFL
jgi:hypothetical protein